MKVTAAITILIAFLTGAMAWHQNFETVILKEQAGSLTTELAKKEALIKQQETLLDTFEQEIARSQAEMDTLRNEIATASSSSSNPEQGVQLSPMPSRSKNSAAEVLARVSTDPKMKEIFRQWNSAKIKEIYGDFVKDRRLSPIQAKQFFDLLTEERVRKKDEYFSLFATGERDTGPTNTRIESWKKQKAEIEQQLRILLGEGDYAEFEQYRGREGD